MRIQYNNNNNVYTFKIDNHIVDIITFYNRYINKRDMQIWWQYNNNELQQKLVYDNNSYRDRILFTDYCITNRQKEILIKYIKRIIKNEL